MEAHSGTAGPATSGHQPLLCGHPSRPATTIAAARPPAAQPAAHPPPPWRPSAAGLRNPPRQVCACCWLLSSYQLDWPCSLRAPCSPFPVLTLCILACPTLLPCILRCLLPLCTNRLLMIVAGRSVLVGMAAWILLRLSGSPGATAKSQIQEWAFAGVSRSPYKLVHLQSGLPCGRVFCTQPHGLAHESGRGGPAPGAQLPAAICK